MTEADTDRFVDLPAGPRICYRLDGPENGRPLVLLAGLGLDLTSWSPPLVDGLTDRGFRVIRQDNRDIGRSARIETRVPSVLRRMLWSPPRDAYDLADMAADTVGLLDHLGIERVHLVGMSMGGMIAQVLTARHPRRVASLTSIFSTTGARRVGQPSLGSAVRVIRRPSRTEEEYVTRHLATLGRIGSATLAPDETWERSWASDAWQRGGGSLGPGVARQLGAIQGSGDRTADLRRITVPTLVVHGPEDRMVHPSGGRATAEAIPGSRHVEVPAMGHHIAPGVTDRIVDLVADHATAADARREAGTTGEPATRASGGRA